MGFEQRLHGAIDGRLLALERSDRACHQPPYRGRGQRGLLALRLQCDHDLAAPPQPVPQLALPRLRGVMATQPVVEQARHLTQPAGVDGIGLGKLPRGPREVACLPWVHPCHPQAGIAAGLQHGILVTARRLGHNPHVGDIAQMPQQLADPDRAVVESNHAGHPFHGDIQRRLAHIDAYCRHCHSPLECQVESIASRPTLIGTRATSRNCSGARREIRCAAPAELRCRYTKALSGAHTGLSTLSLRKFQDIRR